jgi:hypothetical protein
LGCGVVKKFISLVMSLILIVMVIPILNIEVNASTSGDCGENVIWDYDDITKVLTVYGEGDMKEYNAFYTFDGNVSEIKTIIISDGVTSIGSYFFGICESAISISIPISITKISKKVFENCSSLRNVYYEGTEVQWNEIVIVPEGNACLLNAKINYKEEPHICSYGEWIITNEPTCVGDGSKVRNCSCGSKDVDTIPATGIHNYKWQISVPATCTESGEEEQQCIVCNEIGESRTINMLGHDKSDWKTLTTASCTSKGLKAILCNNCGEVLEQAEIEQLPHNFGNWVVKVKETEEQDGEETRTCKSCKYTESRVIDNIQSSDNNVIGDANGDGKVKATDARLVLQVVAGLKKNEDLNFSNADVNDDDKITAVDARMILQIVAGII